MRKQYAASVNRRGIKLNRFLNYCSRHIGWNALLGRLEKRCSYGRRRRKAKDYASFGERWNRWKNYKCITIRIASLSSSAGDLVKRESMRGWSWEWWNCCCCDGKERLVWIMVREEDDGRRQDTDNRQEQTQTDRTRQDTQHIKSGVEWK